MCRGTGGSESQEILCLTFVHGIETLRLRQVRWASLLKLRLTLFPHGKTANVQGSLAQLEVMNMKTCPSRRQTAKVSHSRWLAYATASAATALAGSHSAEAAIHYSGILNQKFPPHIDTDRTFPLDQAGDFLLFQRHETLFNRLNVDFFKVYGIASDGIACVASRFGGCYRTPSYNYLHLYVSKLQHGQNVSSVFFDYHFVTGGFMAFGTTYGDFGPWRDRGPGCVGFKFNNGAGIQYGWVRIRMYGPPEHGFEVVSYAYADPGERIKAGQKSSREEVPDQDSTDEQAPDEGSLGGLALGAVGLLAWRKSRSRTARLEDA